MAGDAGAAWTLRQVDSQARSTGALALLREPRANADDPSPSLPSRMGAHGDGAPDRRSDLREEARRDETAGRGPARGLDPGAATTMRGPVRTGATPDGRVFLPARASVAGGVTHPVTTGYRGLWPRA